MSEIISREMIVLDLEAKDKDEVIEKLSRVIEKQGKLIDLKGYIEQVKDREKTFATSVGFDFAIPHGKCDSVKSAAVAFARLKDEIKWSDEEVAKYIFLIAVPESEAGDTHLKILAQLSRKIMREEFREKLEKSNDIEEVLENLTV